MRKLSVYIPIILISVSLFLGNCVYSQYNSEKISIRADNNNLEWVIEQIESQTSYRFYFNRADIDSIHITGTFSNITIPAFLEKILTNTGIRFSIDQKNKIYLSKSFIIFTALPDDYYNPKNNTADNVLVDISVPEIKISKNKKNALNKLYEIGKPNNNNSKVTARLNGYIKDGRNGEVISGASITCDSPYTSVITDQFGYYSISLSKGTNFIKVSSIGMKEISMQLMVNGDGKIDLELEENITTLKGVTVEADKQSKLRSTQIGIERINAKTIKQIPAVLGEADVLRAILTLPGVTSVGEASTGFNVRGGATDQNLILFNDATIFNPSHLFGFFSAFNADMIKGVELYKSAIPSKYGGRLSSVLAVSGREGSNKKITTTGGIGLLTGKLTIEGPLNKDKTTFIISGRTTYSDWLLKQIPDKSYENSNASFYDFTATVSHKFNNKNSLSITGYISKDRFKLNSDTAYTYGNRNIVAKWKHIFNNRLFGILTGGTDDYRFSVGSNKVPLNAYTLSYRINQTHARAELSFTPNNSHSFTGGIQNIYYKIRPGAFTPALNESLVKPDIIDPQQAIESSLYISDKYTINSRLTINVGIRYSFYSFLGPQQIATYIPDMPRNASTRIGVQKYEGGKSIQTYHGPEFRIDGRYSIADNQSVKISFNTLRQYLHTLSNTTSISPTDVIQLSNTYIKPQIGFQLALGYYVNHASRNFETSIEVYYKQMKQYLDFKSGAQLIMNRNIETDIINTQGKAYGAELMIKKTTGKLSGWFSYTFSKTLLQQDDKLAGEQINNGNYYPANFDRPHNINLVSIYKFSHRLSLSVTGVYGSGRPITLPIALFTQGGAQRVLYSERNEYRIKDYIRADLSLNIEGNHKIKKLAHSSWSLGVYNATARANPYSVYFVEENGTIKGYQLSIFATAIPFITYNFNF